MSLLPSPALLVRSATLAAVLVAAVVLALSSWFVFYSSTAVTVGTQEVVWLQYGHFRPPYAEVRLQPSSYFSSGQAYDVSLEIVVPTTTRNVQLGNFMVNLALIKEDGRAAFNVSRPASLAYRSPVSLALAAVSPLALLRSPDVQRLVIPLMESTILKTRSTTPHLAFVELGRRDAHWETDRWSGGGGEVQVYSARLRFHAHLTGLRYLLYHHPILVFSCFVPSFLVLELLTAALIWASFVVQATPSLAPLVSGQPVSTPGSLSSNSSQLASETTSRIKREFGLRDAEEIEAAQAREMDARRRAGVRMGGGVLEELGSESGSSTEEGSSHGTIQGDTQRVKIEPSEEDTDEGNTEGSATTAGSKTTFGPSLASTSTYGSSPSSRSRAARTNI